MAMATLVVGACGLLFAIILAVQWPEVRAAELTRRNDRIEDELVLATLARSRADFADCIRHFRQAIELGPERSEAIAGLCLAIYYGEGAERALQESERHPGTQHLLRVRAFLLGELGRKDEALAISTRLGEPRDWIELWLTAVPLAREGAAAADLHHADQLLTRAILVEPRPRLWLHVQFAALQVLRRDDDGRRLAAEALLTVWPDNPRAKAIAGTCLLTSDPHRAAELLAGSFDDSGHDALNRVNLGFALALARRPGEGAAEMERAMGDSNLTDAHRVRVLQVLHMIAEYDREKRLAEEWLSRQPDNVSAKWFVARTTARSGGTARALQLFRECVEAAPANFDVRLDYALGLQMAGELDEAVVQAKRVAEQQPGLERAHDLLVDLYRLRNDGEAVIAELERWVGKEPENAKSWRCLAGEYLRRDGAGDTARALDAAERSVRLTKGRDTEALGMHADALEHHGDTAAAARLRAQIAALKPTEPKR
jgi:cytochrome c-type biogenesis protein CcmH/NrfG